MLESYLPYEEEEEDLPLPPPYPLLSQGGEADLEAADYDEDGDEVLADLVQRPFLTMDDVDLATYVAMKSKVMDIVGS